MQQLVRSLEIRVERTRVTRDRFSGSEHKPLTTSPGILGDGARKHNLGRASGQTRSSPVYHPEKPGRVAGRCKRTPSGPRLVATAASIERERRAYALNLGR